MAAHTPNRMRALIATAALLGSLVALAGGVTTVAAADEVSVEAHALLEGHGRVGAWMAIAVDITNSGPPIVGELRIAAGSQGRTRFSTAADLPTNSSKRFYLYAQPPSFGRSVDVVLVSGEQTIVKRAVEFALAEQGQLVVGVVAEKPQGIVGAIDIAPAQNNLAPVIVTLDPSDLPQRVEGWAALDRLVWQDVDTNDLSSDQIAALEAWLAGGGRLIIAGGTAGPGVLSALPDEILPFRPTATVDMAPASLAGMLGELPASATDLPALSGTLARGRALATSGDIATAAEAPYGSGAVTIVGFDPSAEWIADSAAAQALWQRLLPARSGTAVSFGDDSQLLQAVASLPSLALPPIGGLIVLLIGYIILIGPVNYFVLRRLDRREWAWFTMPALIVVFAVGSYGFGAALRGSDILVNEVSIVRGAPDTTVGQAQIYVGVFSPSRHTYQLQVPGGALLSAPINGDMFGSQDAGALDVVQGDPARVRNLAVGFGSLRAVRAESVAPVPRITADLQLEDGRLVGTVQNLSERKLERPAVVLGGNVAALPDLEAGAKTEINLALAANPFGQSLSDRILSQDFLRNPTFDGGQNQELTIRSGVLSQLTWDPNFGPTGQLQAEGPVLLAWGHDPVLNVAIEGQVTRHTANILYYLPLGLQVRGATVFRSDLIRNSIVSLDAPLFQKGPFDLGFGQGSISVAYRPIVFEGSIRPTKVLLGMGFGGEFNALPAVEIAPQSVEEVGPQPEPSAEPSPEPVVCITKPCNNPGQPVPLPANFDGLPDVEIFDRSSGGWMTMGHLEQGRVYSIEKPERFVDPATGSVIIRFVNDRQDSVGFQFNVQIEGEIS